VNVRANVYDFRSILKANPDYQNQRLIKGTGKIP